MPSNQANTNIKSIDITVKPSATKPTNSKTLKPATPSTSAGKSTQPPKPPTNSAKKSWSKKRKIWTIVAGSVVALAVLSFVGYRLFFRHTTQNRLDTVAKVKKDAMSKLVPAPLTGLAVTTTTAKKPVVGLIIENLYPDARPQSGLSAAGTVYEAVAEGGITRFEAFYQEPPPPDMGPIRSLRTYFAYWAVEYDAPVVHVGGNMDALDLIGQIGMKNLDQFANGSYFRRINTRVGPHNLYISGDQLTKLVADHGFAVAPTFTPWPRKNDSKSVKPNASTVIVDFSSKNYQAKYTYNPTTDDYTRYIGGILANDANGNVPIKPKTVIVMYIPTSYGKTRIGEDTVIMGVIGSGKAMVFQDGTVTTGTWQKTSAAARTTFTDVAGKPISLNKGQTWVSVVPEGRLATYQ